MKFRVMRSGKLFWMVLAVCWMVMPAFSQQMLPPPDGEPLFRGMENERQGHRHENGRREKARDMMMQLKIWKMTEELQVDEKLSEKLYPRVRELDSLRFEQSRQMESRMKALRTLLDQPEPNMEELKVIIQELQKMRLEHLTAETRHLERIFELLTPEQQARFMLLEADFHQNIRRFLRDQNREFREPGREPERRRDMDPADESDLPR